MKILRFNQVVLILMTRTSSNNTQSVLQVARHNELKCNTSGLSWTHT